MKKFRGYFCPNCNYIITNADQLHWEKHGVVSIPKCNYHKVKVEVRFEETKGKIMVTLTETAVKEIKHIIVDQKLENEVYVRAGVRGGGCSGYKFLFTLDETYNPEKDMIFEQEGLKIVVDKKSHLYIDGTTIDFQDTLESRGFKFDNPNSTGTCGCKSSFSV